MKYLLIIPIFCAFIMTAHAQDAAPSAAADAATSTEQVTTEKARVLQIVSQDTQDVPGTSISSVVQTIKVQVLSGDEQGQTLVVENDYMPMSVGETFYMTHTSDPSQGIDQHTVSDPYRIPVLVFFALLFVALVVIFGGMQGARGLIALAIGLFFIGYLLLPGIIRGYPPVLMSVGIASLIIILGSYITHGFNKVTSSAVVGMIATIIVTGLLAYAAIHLSHLSGFSTEESLYLDIDTNGSIDFSGLLFGGILIGLLGVLYDAAIGQAVAVDELHQVGPHLSRATIFRRALRLGREHIGALVNILAIAYVGASLPLLLLFYDSGASFALTVNREIFATEIIRALVGSIGLVLAVPTTTLIAVFMLMKKKQIE